MSEILFRSFSPDLEIQTRAKGGDGRTVVGIAVPYGMKKRIDAGLTEQFAYGAFAHQIRAAHRVAFSRDHIDLGGSLIGRLMLMREDQAGLYIEARASHTPTGDETLALIEDGALDRLSIGFREVHNRRLSDGTVERTRADLREVAVVLEGAYGEEALVTGVRSADVAKAISRMDEARQILAGLPPLPTR